jgi:hypothetical protein
MGLAVGQSANKAAAKKRSATATSDDTKKSRIEGHYQFFA